MRGRQVSPGRRGPRAPSAAFATASPTGQRAFPAMWPPRERSKSQAGQPTSPAFPPPQASPAQGRENGGTLDGMAARSPRQYWRARKPQPCAFAAPGRTAPRRAGDWKAGRQRRPGPWRCAIRGDPGSSSAPAQLSLSPLPPLGKSPFRVCPARRAPFSARPASLVPLPSLLVPRPGSLFPILFGPSLVPSPYSPSRSARPSSRVPRP